MLNSYRTDGQGEVQKQPGEIKTAISYGPEGDEGAEEGGGESDESEDQPDGITLTKKELSEKIVGGRDEGIEKGRRDTLKAVNSTLGTEFNDVDELTEQLSEAHIGDVEETEVVQNLQSKLEEANSTIENLNGKIQDIRTEGQVLSNLEEQLGDNDLAVSPKDLKVLYSQEHGYVEKDGELFATKNGDRFLNDKGQYTKYSEGLLNYAQQKGLLQGKAQGGTGGGSKPSSGGSENPFETGNMTEQARLYREDRERYKRLKNAASKK